MSGSVSTKTPSQSKMMSLELSILCPWWSGSPSRVFVECLLEVLRTRLGEPDHRGAPMLFVPRVRVLWGLLA